MGFFDDIREVGIGAQGDQVDQSKSDMHKLAAIISALSTQELLCKDPKNPSPAEWQLMSQLTLCRKEFESGQINESWMAQATDWIMAARNHIRNRLDLATSAGAFQNWDTQYAELAGKAREAYQGKIVSVMAPQVEAPKPTLQPMPGSHKPISQTRMHESHKQVALDLEAQGLLNPDGPEHNTPVNDPHALAPILFAMEACFDEMKYDLAKPLKELKNEYYEKQHIGPDWAQRTSAALDAAFREGMKPEIDVVNTNRFAGYYKSCYAHAKSSFDPELVTVDGTTPTFTDDLKMLGVSLKAEDKKSVEGTIAEITPVLRAMTEMMASVPGFESSLSMEKLSKARQQYETTGKLDEDAQKEVGGALYDAWKDVYMKLGATEREAFNKTYRERVDVAKRVYSLAPIDLQQQKEKVYAIQDIQEKMKAESGLHLNSSEYKRMREAVNEVCSIAESGAYKNGDKKAISDMEAALDRLNQAADAYADKEAYKTKRTDRGIERRNTALSLLAITDPRGRKGAEEKVEAKAEKRMKDKSFARDSAGLTGKPKERVKFSKLVKEEKIRTRSLAHERSKASKAAQKGKKQPQSGMGGK